jgi:hypothetical protein
MAKMKNFDPEVIREMIAGLADQLLPEADENQRREWCDAAYNFCENEITSDMMRQSFNNLYGGQYYGSFASYISFFRDTLHWENDSLPRFKHYENLAISAGYGWIHEQVAIVSDRPLYIHRDENARLHAENTPAIEYRDGWKLFSWHGIRVPSYVIMEPDKITIEDIDAERNQEIRRIKLHRFGIPRYVADAPVIHEDFTGKLRRKTNRQGDNVAVVEVINGSPEPDGTYRTYFLTVPPDSTTAIGAVAWTYGMTVKEYSKMVART